jgi:hypothetical protein
MTSVRLFPERTNQRGDWALREEEKKKRCQPPNLGTLHLAYFWGPQQNSWLRGQLKFFAGIPPT